MFGNHLGESLCVVNFSTRFKQNYLNNCFDNDVRMISRDNKRFTKFSLYCGRRHFFRYMDDVLGDQYSIADKCAISGHKSFQTLMQFYLRKRQRERVDKIVELL